MLLLDALNLGEYLALFGGLGLVARDADHNAVSGGEGLAFLDVRRLRRIHFQMVKLERHAHGSAPLATFFPDGVDRALSDLPRNWRAEPLALSHECATRTTDRATPALSCSAPLDCGRAPWI